MKTLKDFFKTKTGKRALWTMLNSLMALVVAYLTYDASNSVDFAVVVFPVAQAVSQLFTKYLNAKHAT